MKDLKFLLIYFFVISHGVIQANTDIGPDDDPDTDDRSSLDIAYYNAMKLISVLEHLIKINPKHPG